MKFNLQSHLNDSIEIHGDLIITGLGFVNWCALFVPENVSNDVANAYQISYDMDLECYVPELAQRFADYLTSIINTAI